MADLSQSVLLGGAELNDATIVTPGGPLVGCLVESIDYSGLEVRQNINPLAKSNGAEAGGVWVTSRTVTMRGTVYGANRTDAYNRLAALQAVAIPATGQVYGTTTLVFHVATTGGDIERTITVRPNGLRHRDIRTYHGGSSDSFPLAIEWTLTLLAQPAYSDVATYYGQAIQSSIAFVTWGYQKAVLPIAPEEGDLLVAFTISRSYGHVPSAGPAWNLEGYVMGNNDYGGYFASPVYLRCWSRVAGPSETTEVLDFGGVIGSGLGVGCYTYLMEFAAGSVVEQVATDAYQFPPYTRKGATATATTPGTLFGVFAYGRQGYFGAEYLTPDAGNTVSINDGSWAPGLFVAEDWGLGALSVGGTSGYWIESNGQRPSGQLSALVRSA